MSGFVQAADRAAISAFGDDLLAMPDFQRARWGIRRTFQTEQAIASLTVFDNVLLVQEHTGGEPPCPAPGGDGRHQLRRVEAKPSKQVATLGAAQRRLVEVARAVVGTPALVLLDEPAAGLPDDETEHLAKVIKRIPAETGALVILVDHDMSLVSACCATAAVLDFGKLIASGPRPRSSATSTSSSAYLGTEEEL